MLRDLLSSLGFNSRGREGFGDGFIAPDAQADSKPADNICVKVVGVGGAGGNAVARMHSRGIRQVELLALNTDVQALDRITGIASYAIGPQAVNGLGSGGRPEMGRRAIRESRRDIAALLDGADMVFVTAGMGGGTGTGASPTVADIARKKGALTVGVVTMPFSFEGSHRRNVAEQGLHNLRQGGHAHRCGERSFAPVAKGQDVVGEGFCGG